MASPPTPKKELRGQDSSNSFLSLLSRGRSQDGDSPPPPQEPGSSRPASDHFHSVEDLAAAQQFSSFHLVVHLKQGHDLPAKDTNGTSDPYVKFLLGGKQVYKSKTVYRDLNPFWDETFQITVDDISAPLDLKVYDYDWGLRDDFMGEASLPLGQLVPQKWNDLVLTLSETGRAEYLGQLSLEVRFTPVSSAGGEEAGEKKGSHGHGQANSPFKPKLKSAGGWTAVVTVVLIDGSDLLAMDEGGTSDPYCKFKLGKDYYKSKVVYETLNPKWCEQFDLYLYEQDFAGQTLEVTVWDKDQRSKDDFMGRCSVDLHNMEREVTHKISSQLEDGAGKLNLAVTISGTTDPEAKTFLPMWDQSAEAAKKRKDAFSLSRTLSALSVGILVVRVYRAKGLVAADMGGTSDPYCVLELDNTRVATHTEYKTLEPAWHRVFELQVADVHGILYLTVYDEDKNHKSEFLGRIAVPLLKMESKEKRWYALKDKKLRCRAKGTLPQIQLGFQMEWNPLRATMVTLNPREETLVPRVGKFNRAIFVNNVMRIKSCVVSILDFVQFIKSCLEWENPVRSVISFVVFMTISWYFEPYMVPVGLLLIFLKQYIVTSYIEKPSRELSPTLEEEEEEHEEPENKEEKMSLKERLQAVQDVTAMVQNALGEVAGMAESIKNTFNFSVPFLSWLGIIILLVVAIFLYFIPCRLIVMGWGINKFAKKLIAPDSNPNNELLDFLSRVPNDETLQDCRPLKLQPDEEVSTKKSTTKRKSVAK